jgi:hypothetical protein
MAAPARSIRNAGGYGSRLALRLAGTTKESAYLSFAAAMDCFAEPVIGRRFAPTRWLAMTVLLFEN